MRVLMIVRQFFPWIGGTEKQAQKLSARLIELGIDVQVVTGWWVWGTRRRETIDSTPVFRNFTCWGMFGIKGLRKFGGYLYILSLLWYLWRHRKEYNLIHIHMLSYPAFPAMVAARWFAKKTVIKMANSGQYSDIRRMKEDFLLPGQRLMLPLVLSADQIVATNERIVEELYEAGVPSDRIVVIPNGVETKGLRHKADYRINDLATLIFAGRLDRQKGLDVLLLALNQVIRERPDIGWRLWLMGDGPLRAQLEMMSRQLDVFNNVEFWGQVNNVADYLGLADMFVLPSWAEGMSNALLEAMAHGLPCVASRISGNVDLIRHGENGLLVPPGSSSALAEAIIHLADDEVLRQKAGRSARQLIEDGYSIDIIANKYRALYNSQLRGVN